MFSFLYVCVCFALYFRKDIQIIYFTDVQHITFHTIWNIFGIYTRRYCNWYSENSVYKFFGKCYLNGKIKCCIYLGGNEGVGAKKIKSNKECKMQNVLYTISCLLFVQYRISLFNLKNFNLNLYTNTFNILPTLFLYTSTYPTLPVLSCQKYK